MELKLALSELLTFCTMLDRCWSRKKCGPPTRSNMIVHTCMHDTGVARPATKSNERTNDRSVDRSVKKGIRPHTLSINRISVISRCLRGRVRAVSSKMPSTEECKTALKFIDISFPSNFNN